MRKTLAAFSLIRTHLSVLGTSRSSLITQYLEWYSQLTAGQVSETPTSPLAQMSSEVFEQHVPAMLRTYRPVLGLVTLDHLKRLMPIFTETLEVFLCRHPYPAAKDTATCVSDYRELKSALFQNGHVAWARFNPRSGKVFMWCHVMIGRLVVSPLTQLLESDKARDRAQQRILRLALKIVHLDTRIDDLADVLHDEKLVDLAVRLVTAPPTEFESTAATVLDELTTYNGGIFKPYFENTVSLWRDVISEISRLGVTGPYGESLVLKLREDMAELMESMRFSVALNKQRCLPSLAEMERKLASNMMVKIIFDICRIVLSCEGVELPKELEAPFREFESTLQILFRLANNIATREREVRERDMTNMIFAITQKFLTGGYAQWLETHPGQAFGAYIFSERLANGESEGFSWASFGDLFSLREQSDISTMISESMQIAVRNGLVLQADFGQGDAHHFVTELRSAVQTQKLPADEEQKLTDLLGRLESALVLENKKTNVLCKFLLHDSVMADFYAYWCSKSCTLDGIIDDNIRQVPETWRSAEKYVAAMRQYKDNNIVFLLSYLVFSMVKGAT
jgi:hypothetical protein